MRMRSQLGIVHFFIGYETIASWQERGRPNSRDCNCVTVKSDSLEVFGGLDKSALQCPELASSDDVRSTSRCENNRTERAGLKERPDEMAGERVVWTISGRQRQTTEKTETYINSHEKTVQLYRFFGSGHTNSSSSPVFFSFLLFCHLSFWIIFIVPSSTPSLQILLYHSDTKRETSTRILLKIDRKMLFDGK